MAILRQARIAHCRVHCSCLSGVGGMTETALTPPSSSSSIFIRSSLLPPVCCHAFTVTHNHIRLYSTLKIQLSSFLPHVRYSFSFPSSKLQHSDALRYVGLLLNPRLPPFSLLFFTSHLNKLLMTKMRE